MPLLKVQFNNGQLQVNPRGKQVALTFDDGPAEHTIAILDILKKEKVKAVFFLIGKNIAGNENIVQRMKAEGHQIGGHSYFHGFNFDWQSTKKMQLEIENTNSEIEKITCNKVNLFRPPYGVTTPNLAKAIQAAAVKSIGWNLRSMDTVAKDAQQLTDKILGKLKSGSIILLHDRCAITVQILPDLIQEIKKRSFDFATL